MTNKNKPRPRETHNQPKEKIITPRWVIEQNNRLSDKFADIKNSNKIVLTYLWYFEQDDFYNQLKYFVDAGYEIYVLLIGSIKYDFSDRFNPKVFHGPFFGPYGKWLNL